ncbi:MAG: YqcC family protein [Thiohalocapsa sp.]
MSDPDASARANLAELLDALTDELRRLDLWETMPPPGPALDSRLPFCCDRLRFSQWLQWVFVPRTRALLDAGGAFALKSAIRPMAEEALSGCAWDPDPLLRLLGSIDQTINRLPAAVGGDRTPGATPID